jgi:hypothetical protein
MHAASMGAAAITDGFYSMICGAALPSRFDPSRNLSQAVDFV